MNLRRRLRRYVPRSRWTKLSIGLLVCLSFLLAAEGALALEVGDGQAAGVAATLERLGYQEVRVTPDLAERPRVVEGRR